MPGPQKAQKAQTKYLEEVLKGGYGFIEHPQQATLHSTDLRLLCLLWPW